MPSVQDTLNQQWTTKLGFPTGPGAARLPNFTGIYGRLTPGYPAGGSGGGASAAPTYANVPPPAPFMQPSLSPTVPGTYNTYSPAFGAKPAVPDPATSAAAATTGNLANFPNINTLTGEVNASNQAAVLGNVGANIPNYTALTKQRSQNIGDYLAGQVPQDVQDLLQNRSAELGVAAGMPGSEAVNYADLASLGLTSLGLQKEGATELGSALSTMPQIPIYDPTQQFVSPTEIQSAQYAANVIGAAPDPTIAADTAFQRTLQLRALDEAQQNAMANQDFQRAVELEKLRAALNPNTTGSRAGGQPSQPSMGGFPGYGYNEAAPSYSRIYGGQPAVDPNIDPQTGLSFAPTPDPSTWGSYDPFAVGTADQYPQTLADYYPTEAASYDPTGDNYYYLTGDLGGY